ncbi:MAG: T9SS type A sorting domain-containing protein [Melioribacter sp.]|nr:T9SS type A sorting domain-containing protein [Melioribacter sp.]
MTKKIKSCCLIILISITIYGQRSSTGLIPLNDLGSGLYKNFQGGLYLNGSNLRPAKHDFLGIELSKQIKPIDKNGNVDTLLGKYVLLSIGMSNTTQEFSYFKTIADTYKTKNPNLIIVDGAQGGQTAAIISNPNANFWTVIEQRLAQAGTTSKQVTVCWLKEADANPTQAFPVHANILTNELIAIVNNIKIKFPNCLLVYCSSRTYGGYATTSLNPEPFAYESGFSVKWLIEKQITGDTELVFTGNNPKAPWLSWGPYLWADGIIPRSDGLVWLQTDFRSDDGTHPSTNGQKKVAELLLNFFKTDVTAKNWFLKNPITSYQQTEINTVPDNYQLYQNYPNPFNPSTTIVYQLPSSSWVTLKVFDMLGREVTTLVNEYKQAGRYNCEWRIDNGELSSGVYFYTIKAGNFFKSEKMILIK